MAVARTYRPRIRNHSRVRNALIYVLPYAITESVIVGRPLVPFMDAPRYLARLGVSLDDQSQTNRHLRYLQRRHLRTIPFTNHFVRNGDGTTLRAETAVPRISGGGGGLCYDLNGAFAWLLEELGYDVTFVSGRPMHDDGSYGPEYDHLALVVDDRLVDVGFGGEFARQPLPLDGAPRSDVSGMYRVFEDDDGHAAQKRTDDGWGDVYRFDPTPRAPNEFAEMMEYHATAADAPFTGDLLATRPTEDGRLTLSSDTLTRTNHGNQSKRDVSREQLNAVLREEFGLVSPANWNE